MVEKRSDSSSSVWRPQDSLTLWDGRCFAVRRWVTPTARNTSPDLPEMRRLRAAARWFRDACARAISRLRSGSCPGIGRRLAKREARLWSLDHRDGHLRAVPDG
jgi:hypothetical protein